jgi:hypothetical protein
MNKNILKPNSSTGTQDLTRLVKIFDRIVDEGEIVLENAENIKFCGDESIWDACLYTEEAEEMRDRWSREILYFLEDEFGNDSAIYDKLRVILQVSYSMPYDEIEVLRDCLAILRTERQNLTAGIEKVKSSKRENGGGIICPTGSVS